MSELALSGERARIVTASAVGLLAGCGDEVRRARQRTCIGCRSAGSREDLVRFVASKDGRVVFDLAGGAWGRGAWIHPRTGCLVKSVRSLGRALRQPSTQTATELHQALATAAWRRIKNLVVSAKRAGQLRVGTEEAERAWEDRSLALLLWVDDVRAGANLPWIAQLLAEGRVLVAPSLATMSEWVGVQEVTLAAITDSRIATAVVRNLAIAQIPAPALASRRSGTGTEVG
jgi:predicted RNA-binding protein YlxR (DUF448 family)